MFLLVLEIACSQFFGAAVKDFGPNLFLLLQPPYALPYFVRLCDFISFFLFWDSLPSAVLFLLYSIFFFLILSTKKDPFLISHKKCSFFYFHFFLVLWLILGFCIFKFFAFILCKLVLSHLMHLTRLTFAAFVLHLDSFFFVTLFFLSFETKHIPSINLFLFFFTIHGLFWKKIYILS